MGSHGYVLYRIKPTSTLVLGDSILNQAAIYFDYNQPVITNVTQTVVDNTTGVYTAKDIAFSVYPNPAKGAILVQSELQGTLAYRCVRS